MIRLFLVLACLLGLAETLHAQATIRIDAGLLENSTGTAVEPVGGLLELIASPSGIFSAPNSNSYVSGDNVLVESFAMNNNPGTPGETFNTLSSIPFMTSNYTITAGEQVILRFYPSLTYASAPVAPTLGTTYGQVRSGMVEFGPSGGDASETAWVIPASGTTVDLDYITSNDGGTTTYTPVSAYATNIVPIGAVPEPATYALLAGAFLGLTSLRAWSGRGKAS